tara:strand:+ start:2638 stop:3141 length:504 start_codon:yes stop_codon:yes gene_type:complete
MAGYSSGGASAPAPQGEIGRWYADTVANVTLSGGYTVIWANQDIKTFTGTPMDVATGIFTVPTTGYYRIDIQVILKDMVSTTATRYQYNLLRTRGGVATTVMMSRFDPTADMTHLTQSLNGFISLTAADTLHLALFQDGGGGSDTADLDGANAGYTYFCIERMVSVG